MEGSSGNSGSREAAALKAFLMKRSTKSGRNVYDHLTQLITKIMDEHPDNAVDLIEEMSHDVKRASFSGTRSTLRDLPQCLSTELLAEPQRSLFSQPDEAVYREDGGETVLPNVSEIGFYLEQAEVGLGREEMQRIFLALKQLVDSEALPHCRLWGKILGIESNYIIAEAEYREGEEDQESFEEEGEEEQEEPGSLEKEAVETNPLPQSAYKPQRDVPKEKIGTGANKFCYYVCTEPGLSWTRLPPVTPAQIDVARQIRRFFTGQLNRPVVSYPPFPGNEANYLRAQIARISAGTQVSPRGFYQAVEEEGDEEDELPRDGFEVNPDFESIPAHEMAESLSSWVHHVQHILQQGRCTWVNVAVKPDEDSNEEIDADEREDEAEEAEPEVGPSLLTPVSEDAEMFHTPPWSSKLSSVLTHQHAIAVLRSNLWPGAVAYACGKKFENIYIGWGLKYVGGVYSPTLPPPPQTEYPTGPEITEALDPTPEEEQTLIDDLEEQQAVLEETEESEEDDD